MKSWDDVIKKADEVMKPIGGNKMDNSNYPAGVTDGHPYFNQPDPPEYSHSDALYWIECKRLEKKFDAYVAENDFPEIKELFHAELHPDQMLECAENDWEPSGEYPDLWHTFLWEVLDAKRFKILVEAFTSSRIDDYNEFVEA